MADNINPTHYKECSFECIEMMEALFDWKAVYDFCICNAFKYSWRCSNKNGNEDIQKARWYVNKARELGGWNEQLEMLTRVIDKAEQLLKESDKND